MSQFWTKLYCCEFYSNHPYLLSLDNPNFSLTLLFYLLLLFFVTKLSHKTFSCLFRPKWHEVHKILKYREKYQTPNIVNLRNLYRLAKNYWAEHHKINALHVDIRYFLWIWCLIFCFSVGGLPLLSFDNCFHLQLIINHAHYFSIYKFYVKYYLYSAHTQWFIFAIKIISNIKQLVPHVLLY